MMFNKLYSIRIHFVMAILIDVFPSFYWWIWGIGILYMFGRSFIPTMEFYLNDDAETFIVKVKLRLMLSTFACIFGLIVGLMLRNRANKYYKIGIA